MSLPLKDVRLKLDAEMHAAMTILADVAGVTDADWYERELARVIREQIHAASIVATRLRDAGITGNRRGERGIGLVRGAA